MYPVITLQKGKEESLKRQHPWVFSGAIKSFSKPCNDGEIVCVQNNRNEFLGIGHYQNGRIAIRILSFEKITIDENFWELKLSQALSVRSTIRLVNNSETNCYRLIHAEGDGLPGLIIDIYNNTAVIQCHSIGMHLAVENIAKAILKILNNIAAIYDKSKETLPENYAKNVLNKYVYGSGSPQFVLENNCQFWVDWETGQKTGFFLDQRDNRFLLSHYAKEKTVLNAFCYTGGFSVFALNAGAKLVHSVDVSAKAIEITNINVANCKDVEYRHQSFKEDVMLFLKQAPLKYDIAVIDPPAFAKSLTKRHNAIQAYKRLNINALQCLNKNGLLFTFSCSQVVDNQLFYDTIVAAAIEANRKIMVLHTLSQPADHPVSIFHKEGKYLKGLVLFVE